MPVFALFLMSADNPTLFEAIAAYLLLSGTHSARPSAANAPLGAYYFETDTGETYQNQASTWVLVAINSSSGGSPALEFVDAQTLSADATSIDFSGLNGNTDGNYRLIGMGKIAVASTVAKLQINGADTNLSGAQVYNGGGGTHSYGYLCGSLGVGDYFSFDISINAKANPSGQAFIRLATATIAQPFSGSDYIVVSMIRYNDTSTNITSLSVAGDTTDGLAAGSYARLYKYRQS